MRKRTPFVGVVALAVAALMVPVVAGALETPSSQRFTLAVVPDTQYLFDREQDRGDPQPLVESFEWIADNADERNIVFTAALGDLTEHGSEPEMQSVSEVYDILDDAGMGFSTPAGNHDVDGVTDEERPGDDPYLDYFGPERFEGQPTFGGADPTGYNTFHVFSGGGRDWLLLALDWRMSDASFAWAQQVIDEHAELPVILTTHELVGDLGDGVAGFSEYGQSLWDRLINDNDQVFMGLGGHYWPTARTTMTNAAGNDVELELVNYQEKYYGGAGIIRLYTFDLDESRVDVESFSPWAQREDAEGNALAHQVARPTRIGDRAVDQFSLAMDFEERFAGFAAAPADEPGAPVESALVDGTVAYWRLGDAPDGAAEGTTPVAGDRSLDDLSGNGNDLEIATLPEGDVESLTYSDADDPDQPGSGSLRFDPATRADGAYLRTVEGAPMDDATFTDGYTIEAFVRLPEPCCDGDRAWMGMFSRLGTGVDSGKSGGWNPLAAIATLSVSPSRQLQWEMFPTNLDGTVTNWSHEIETEVWRHVAVVNDGARTSMFVDGAPINRNPRVDAFGIDGEGSSWLVGASSFDNVVEGAFSGWLGDIRVVDRALAPEEWLTGAGTGAGGGGDRSERVGGTNVAEVAVAVSQERFASGSAPSVVLSRDDEFSDALAAGPLAGDMPLLFTGGGALPAVTTAELARVLPAGGTVYLLGSTSAVSAGVADELSGLGYLVVRLEGPSRVETAIAVADQVRRLHPEQERVALARAFGVDGNPTSSWADAVSGGAWAASTGTPVLVTPSDALHPAAAEWLAADQPSSTVLLGGPQALSPAVEAAVPAPLRVAGETRFSTAAQVSRQLWDVDAEGERDFVVVDGYHPQGWAHGLAAAGLSADRGAPLLLVDEGVPGPTRALVASCGEPIVDLVVVGDQTVISDGQLGWLDALDGATCTDPATRSFDLQAHRGGLGLVVASTLAAFRNAIELGVTTLELDVQITEDGAAVVTHDRQVSAGNCQDTAPVTPGDPEFPYVGKYINTLTLAQVRTLDCGSIRNPAHPGMALDPGAQQPLLTEVFDLVNEAGAQDVRLNIETKVEAGAPEQTAPREQFVQIVAAEIAAAGLSDRVTIQSFDWGALTRMHEVAPDLPLVALTNGDFLQVGQPGASPWLGGIDIDDFGGDLVAAVDSIEGVVALSPVHGNPQNGLVSQADYAPYTTREMVDAAHAAGLQVIPWTINDVATMTYLVDLGVDGIITDYPDRLRTVMERTGFPLPEGSPAG